MHLHRAYPSIWRTEVGWKAKISCCNANHAYFDNREVFEWGVEAVLFVNPDNIRGMGHGISVNVPETGFIASF